MSAVPASRAGFGKIPDIPKTLTAKTASGKNAAVATTTSTLKASVSENISTATRSSVFQNKASTSRSSSPFVAGQNNHITYTRNRTASVPHGYYAAQGGKYQLESDMGMTGRSTQRLINNFQKQQQAQQMAYLNNMNAMYGNNYGMQQPKMSVGQFFTEIFTAMKGLGLTPGSSEKGSPVKTAKTVPSSDSTIASMQNATTSSDLSTAISGAKEEVSDIGNKITKAKSDIKELQSKSSGLKTASDNATKAVADNKTAIQNKSGEVQNNINRESASQMAMNAAQSQVDKLQDQLDALPADSQARQNIESSLKQAKEQLDLKTKQYEQAVKDREQSQQDLQGLKDKTQGLESKAATAKADYDNNEQAIKSKESDVNNYGVLQRDMNEVIAQQESRLDELKKNEEKDKK